MIIQTSYRFIIRVAQLDHMLQLILTYYLDTFGFIILKIRVVFRKYQPHFVLKSRVFSHIELYLA